MERLEKAFDAIDARIPANEWDELAHDFVSILNCDFATCYTVRIPAQVPRQSTIHLATDRTAMERYFGDGIYQLQLVDEDEIPGFAPFRCSDLVDMSMYREHPLYTRWGQDIGFFHIAFACLLVSPVELMVLGISRSEDGEDFEGDEITCLGLMARYLRRFIQAKSVVLDGSSNLAEQFDMPVAVVEGERVISSNGAFNDWCRQTDMIEVTGSEQFLSLSDESLAHQVEQQLKHLSHPAVDPAAPPKVQVSLPPSDAHEGHFALQIMPLVSGDGASKRFIWFVHQVNTAESVAGIGAKIGLTTTEIEIFTLLSRGLSARAIADTTNRSYATVRWHIQNILTKSGAASQKELLYKLFNEAN